jgi:hypothetical protein
MRIRTLIPLLALLVPLCAVAANCEYDRARLLALGEHEFDQDHGGGWRKLAAQPGCELVAADLLRDYRQAHRNEAGILYWHEGQLRAFGGQNEQAVAVMEKSREPASKDAFGWNPYVDATVAFLRRDRPALERAHRALLAVAPPAGENVKDGVFEANMADGSKVKMRWPPNIDVVEGLLHCFDRPYRDAYAQACRPQTRP